MNFEIGISFRSSTLRPFVQGLKRDAAAAGKILDELSGKASRVSRSVEDAAKRMATSGVRSTRSLQQTSRGVSGVSESLNDLTRSQRTSESATTSWSKNMTSRLGTVAKGALAAGAAFLSISFGISKVAAASNQFGQVQTGLVGVQKTTDLAKRDLELFNDRLSTLSVGEVPILKTEMLRLAEVSGQLGVRGVDNLTNYVQTLAELGKASDLVGEDAAKRLTRILNVQGEGPENIRRLASVIVELGNSAAAGEGEIARMTTEIALATAPFKTGSTVAAAFGTAMVESGIRAELGGSVIGRTLRSISAATSKGGEDLSRFAEIAGVSASEFVAAWTRSPIDALNLFLKGIGRFGQEAPQALESVGLKGEEVNKVIPVLALNFDNLAMRQRQAAEEAVKMTALTEEAGRAFNTQETDLQRLQNAFLQVGEALGKGLSPTVRGISEEIKEWTLTNKEAAAELGQSLGKGLTLVVGLFKLAADNATVLKVALGALIAVQVATFLSGMASALVSQIAKMISYTGATQAATQAQLQLRAAVAGNVPILGAQGQILSVVTTNTAAAAGSTSALAGAQGTAAASSGRLIAGLNPMVLVVGVLAGAFVLANDAINDWSETLQREIAEIQDSTNGFSASMQALRDATDEVIEANLLEGLSDSLATQTDRLGEVTVARDASREALEKAIRNEQLAIEQGNAHGERLEELKSKQERLTLEWNRAKIEVSTLEGTTGQLIEAMQTYKPTIEEAKADTEAFTGSLGKQKQTVDEVITSLDAEATALGSLAAAALKGTEAFSESARAVEVEKRLRAEASKFTNIQADELDNLRKSIESVIKAETMLAGAKIIRKRKDEVKGLKVLAAAYDEGSDAVDAMRAELKLEESVRRDTTNATAEQREEIEALIRTLDDLRLAAAVREDIRSIEDELEVLDKLSDSLLTTGKSAAELRREIELEAEIEEKIAPLLTQHTRLAEQLAVKQQLLTSIAQGKLPLSQQFITSLQVEATALGEQLALNEAQRRQLEELLTLTDERNQSVGRKEFINGLQQEVKVLKLEADILADAAKNAGIFGDASLDAAVELAVLNNLIAAGIDPTGVWTEEIALAAEEIRNLTVEALSLQGGNDAVSSFGDQWIGVASVIVGAISSIDEQIGEMVGGLADAGEAFQNLGDVAAGDFAAAAAAGAELGGAISGLAISAGLFEGQKGPSQFGGRQAGDRAAEGGVIGGVIGAIIGTALGGQTALGAAIGSIIGTVVGGLIKTGADEGLAQIRQIGNELDLRVTKNEGGLGNVVKKIGNQITGVIDGLEDVLGGEIFLGGLDQIIGGTGISGAGVNLAIKIRDETIRVFVNGLEEEFTNIEDAVSFAVTQLLRNAEFGKGIGENAQQVLRGGNAKSLEDLQGGLGVAQLLDRGTSSARPLADALLQISSLRAKEVRIAKQFGFAISEVIELTNQRINALGNELKATLDSALGIQDFLGFALEFQAGVEDFNAGLENEIAARERVLEATQQQNAEFEASRDAILAEIEARGGLDQVREDAIAEANALGLLDEEFVSLGESLAALGEEGIEPADDSAINLLQSLAEAEAGLASTAAEIAELELALQDLPASIDVQAIIDAFDVAAARSGLALIDLLQQVQGDQFLAIEAQELQGKLFLLQLAAQIAAVEALLTATDLLSDATRDVLNGILDGANQVLEGLISGELELPAPGGRPTGRPSGRSDREARQRELGEVVQDIQELRLAAGGLLQSTIDLNRSFADFEDWIDRARELGIAEEQLAQARLDNFALIERELLAPFEEIIQQAGESNLDTSIRQTSEQFQGALSDAFLVASRRAEAFGTTLDEEFAPLRDIIQDAFALEIGEQVRGQIESFAEAGDLEGLNALIEDLLSTDLSGISPDLQSQFAAMLASLVEAAELAVSEVVETGVTEASAVDLGPIQSFLDIVDGISEVDVELRKLEETFSSITDSLIEAEASEAELQRVREAHGVAIALLRESILESVDQYTDAVVGITETGRQLLDLQELFSTAREGIFATSEEAGTDPRQDITLLAEAYRMALEEIRVGILDSVAGLTDASQGIDEFGRRLIDTQETFSAARGDLQEVADALEAATGGTLQLKAQMLATGGTAKQLAKDFALLERSERRAIQVIGSDFIGSLEQLGTALPTELTLGLAEAQFELAKAQALATALTLAQAGAFDGMALSIEGLLLAITMTEFDPGTIAEEAAVTASRRSSRSSSGADQLDGLRQRVEDQIQAWNRLPLGEVTMQAINLAETLNQVKLDAKAAGVSLDRVDAAFQVAVNSFVDNALKPFEDLNLSPLESELDGIVNQFVDLLVAFEVAGASAEQMARLQTSFTSAIEDFLDRATQGIQDFADELRATDPRVSPGESFQGAQEEFRNILTDAQASDLAALEELEGAARAFRDQAVDFLGGGVGFQEVLDEILAGLDSVGDVEFVPKDIALLQAQADDLAEIVTINAGQPTQPQQSSSFSSLGTSVSQVATAVDAEAATLDTLLRDFNTLTEEEKLLLKDQLLSLRGSETISDAQKALIDDMLDEIEGVNTNTTGTIEVADAKAALAIDDLAFETSVNTRESATRIEAVRDRIGPGNLNAGVDRVSNKILTTNEILRRIDSNIATIAGAREGAFIKRDGLLFVHKNERVLSPRQTEAFEGIGGLSTLATLRDARPRPVMALRRREQAVATAEARRRGAVVVPVARRRATPAPPLPDRRSSVVVSEPARGSAFVDAQVREEMASAARMPAEVKVRVERAQDETTGEDAEAVVDGLEHVESAVSQGSAELASRDLEAIRLQLRQVNNQDDMIVALEAVGAKIDDLNREIRLSRNSQPVGGAS